MKYKPPGGEHHFPDQRERNADRREIKETIGRDVNIMDRTGTILASTDPKRIGQLHTIAKEILEQQLPVLEVAAGGEGPGAQQGG